MTLLTMRVDGARDAVRDFDVEFGDDILCTMIDHGQCSALGETEGGDAPWYTLASLISRTAAVSTMLRTVKRLMALSLGTHREQFEQRTKLTWPRPFLLRPLFLLFLVCTGEGDARREVSELVRN